MTAAVTENDGALVIFTTGSTGAPKPALLSHRNITCQNMCLGAAFGFDTGTRLLVNLPPSHVGGQTEALMTTLFCGGTAVLLEVFDAEKSLEAMARHRVNLLGQIPAMFNLEWRLAGYGATICPACARRSTAASRCRARSWRNWPPWRRASGPAWGSRKPPASALTPTAGATVEEIAASIGLDMPVYPMSIRAPMRPDGRAGAELPGGETGPRLFPRAADVPGLRERPRGHRARDLQRRLALHRRHGFPRRRAACISPAAPSGSSSPRGYQVFPGEVENHLCALREGGAGGRGGGGAQACSPKASWRSWKRSPGRNWTRRN